MKDFMEERAGLIRSLADKADPFIKVRLLKLAIRYETQLRNAGVGNARPSQCAGLLNDLRLEVPPSPNPRQVEALDRGEE